jgi:hypothetical protein
MIEIITGTQFASFEMRLVYLHLCGILIRRGSSNGPPTAGCRVPVRMGDM